MAIFCGCAEARISGTLRASDVKEAKSETGRQTGLGNNYVFGSNYVFEGSKLDFCLLVFRVSACAVVAT